MRKPGLPPTAVQQSCADGLRPASSSVLAEVICCFYDATVGHEPMTIHDAQKAAELQPVRKAIVELGATSVLAIPLKDGEEAVGLLLLMHNKHSQWQPNDVVVLRTLGEQMVTALNNAGLRRLVKNLSVTDEKSGLLKRASYIDLLLAESKRALQNASPLSLLLLQFGRSAAMVKEHGDAAVEAAMEKIGKLAAGNIRSNDLAFRYDTTTIAIILGDTAEKEGMMAVEKLRKLIAEVRLPTKDGAEKGQPLPFSGGLAEAVVKENYDSVDIVTEVINRAEHALSVALTHGPGKVTALGAALAAGAVA